MAWAPAAIGAGAALYSAFKSDDTPTPDYAGTAKEQGAQSRELAELQTRLNRPTTTTPWGSQSWTENVVANPEYEALVKAAEEGRVADWQAYAKALESTPKTITQGWEQNISLSPEQQAIYEAQSATQLGRQQIAQSMLPQARAALGQPMSWSRLPAGGKSLEGRDLATGLDFSDAQGLSSGDEARNRAEQAIYERSTSRLDPRFQEQERELRTRLYNQGLREGDAAFDAEVAKFGQQKEDAYQTAMNEAIMGGGAEASRTFGMDLARRQQEVGEEQARAEFMNRAAAQGLSQDQAISAYQNQLRQQGISEEQMRRNQAINEMNALQSGQQVGMPSFPSFQPASAGETPNLLGAAQAQYGADVNSYNVQQAQQNQLLSSLAQLWPYLYSYGG